MTRIRSGDTVAVAASKADMDAQTARKYQRAGELPSQVRAPHTWRNRPDAYERVWPEIEQALRVNPGLQAKTLFQHLQRQHPGQFQDAQLRTLQRRIKTWRALEGPAKEVFFAQQHEPGALSQSDFTDMSRLGVTIQRELFEHLIYHFTVGRCARRPSDRLPECGGAQAGASGGLYRALSRPDAALRP